MIFKRETFSLITCNIALIRLLFHSSGHPILIKSPRFMNLSLTVLCTNEIFMKNFTLDEKKP